MKKATLLILFVISFHGFSQNNEEINLKPTKNIVTENIHGIDIYIKEYDISNIKNKEDISLIRKIIKLENKTLEILAKNWIKNSNDSKIDFSYYLKRELHKIQELYNTNSHRIKEYHNQTITVKYKIYIDFLESVNAQETSGITGKWFDEYVYDNRH